MRLLCTNDPHKNDHQPETKKIIITIQENNQNRKAHKKKATVCVCVWVLILESLFQCNSCKSIEHVMVAMRRNVGLQPCDDMSSVWVTGANAHVHTNIEARL